MWCIAQHRCVPVGTQMLFASHMNYFQTPKKYVDLVVLRFFFFFIHVHDTAGGSNYHQDHKTIHPWNYPQNTYNNSLAKGVFSGSEMLMNTYVLWLGGWVSSVQSFVNTELL